MTFKSTILITGGTANLGFQAALYIAKARPQSLIVLASRTDKDSAATAINKATGTENAIFIPLDLSSLHGVRAFAEKWKRDDRPPIDILLLNAGLQFPGHLTKTDDGIESTFAINHVGHALLFHLLAPHLTPNAHVVVTSSGTHDPAMKSGLPDAKYTTAEDLASPPPDMVNVPGRQRYASSKLANVLWTYAVQRNLQSSGKPSLQGIRINAFDPGLMPGTGLAREASGFERFLWMRVLPHLIPLLRRLISPNIHTPAESGANLAAIALGEIDQDARGKYFEVRRTIPSSKDSYNVDKQDDLWKWTIIRVAVDDAERAKFAVFE